MTKLLIPAMIMNAQLLYSNGVICLVTLECSWFAVDDDDDDDDEEEEEEEEEEEVWVANHKVALHGAHFFFEFTGCVPLKGPSRKFIV